jgi:hypothetical protein
MATRAYHNLDNVEILDMHRGPELPDSHTLFPPGGCCEGPPGAKLTVMMFYAKRAAKEDLKAQGIRVSSILPRDVRLLAEEILRERWEEFEKLAQPLLLKISAKFTSAAQRKQRSNRKGISVQNSGAK